MTGISPETLFSQVVNTAPYLRFPEGETGPLVLMEDYRQILGNWRNILREGISPEEWLQDYFAICLACHHATVGTFVPTDVDAKIRGILWRETRDPDTLAAMLRLALRARCWSEKEVSVRAVRGVSGHNGEQWSVFAGALGRAIDLGLTELAAEAQSAIEAEIEREDMIFREVLGTRGAELDLLRVSMTLAHNQGDLKQGISFWRKSEALNKVAAHLLEKGKFAKAVAIYQQTGISAEGHRNYPLRPVRCLRSSPTTLLPLSPFLDDWGVTVAKLDDSHEVLDALVSGCIKIAGQQGYYRAIAGMMTSQSTFDNAVRRLPNAAQRALKGGEIRKLATVSRESFESMMRKRARTAAGQG